MQKTASSILILLLALVPLRVSATDDTTTKGKVMSVIDGNTVEILTSENEMVTVVLAEIDCPELTQQYGDKAKAYLERLVLKKEVTVEFRGKDRKGTNLGIVLIKGKTDVRIQLLQQGLAWTAERNPNPDLEIHKNSAAESGKGLWKDDNPTPPWIYRREQSMLQPKSS